MKCPCCREALVRSRYARAIARKCGQCSGYLIEKRRVRTVQKRIDKNVGELVVEAIQESGDDLLGRVRCPSCRNRMDKRLIDRLAFHVDECRNCDSVWLDGGELAKLQLEFETSAQVHELNAMRQRLRTMSPSERKEYEDRIAGLARESSAFKQAFDEVASELLIHQFWRMS